MKIYILSISVGFIVMLLFAIVMAKLSAPFLAELFGESIRKDGQDGLLMPALLGGVFYINGGNEFRF